MSGPAYFTTPLGNAYFDGIEWDLEYSLDLGLKWRDSIGGRPRAARMWLDAYVHDVIEFSATIWTNAAQAAIMEQRLIGGVDGWVFDLALPGLAGAAALPGFGNFDSGLWMYRGCSWVDNLEAMSQKGPRVDLFGYRMSARFSAIGGAASGNPLNERAYTHPVGLQAVPLILQRKFMAHQPQPASIPANPLPVFAPTIAGAYNGTRLDARMSIDHLSSAEADEVVTWARGQRDTPFTLANLSPFGPGRANTSTAIMRNVKVNRGAGWWWDIELDLTKV